MTCFFNLINSNPIIAAVNNSKDLDVALNSPCEVIFILAGNIFNLKEISYKVKKRNKGLYILIDSIDGFSKDTWGLEYIIKNIYPDGIITQKNNLIELSKNMGVFTIQRLIVTDSVSLNEAINSINKTQPDCVEVLPGIIPKIVQKIITDTKMPVIVSGLISNKDDINRIIKSGAKAISSSKENIWYF